MSELADLIRDVIAVANDVTTTLQGTVTLTPYLGQDRFGTESWGAPVSYKAIIVRESRMRFVDETRMALVKAYVAFLQPITPNGTAGRQEPIDPKDKITLPDGFTAPIVETSGLLNPDTNRGYYAEVWMGDLMSSGRRSY